MSTKGVVYYQVWCDEPGCNVNAHEDSDYSAWSDIEGAVSEAEGSDWLLTEDPDRGTLHYCPDHRIEHEEE